MKLIDISEIKESLLTELLSGVDGGTDDSWLKAYEVINRIENIVNDWVDNQPTVKAIPIEWIKKWLETCIPRYDYDRMTYISDVYEMLEDWEEENG